MSDKAKPSPMLEYVMAVIQPPNADIVMSQICSSLDQHMGPLVNQALGRNSVKPTMDHEFGVPQSAIEARRNESSAALEQRWAAARQRSGFAPRYDQVYEEGVQWLDEIAGSPPNEDETMDILHKLPSDTRIECYIGDNRMYRSVEADPSTFRAKAAKARDENKKSWEEGCQRMPGWFSGIYFPGAVYDEWYDGGIYATIDRLHLRLTLRVARWAGNEPDMETNHLELARVGMLDSFAEIGGPDVLAPLLREIAALLDTLAAASPNT